MSLLNPLTKKFEVSFYYTIYGKVTLDAKSRADAINQLNDKLEADGLPEDYIEKDRDYNATEAEKQE